MPQAPEPSVASIPAPEAPTVPAPAARAQPRFTPRLEDDAVPAEEWALSYADMVTLLLTMFVALLLNARYDAAPSDRAGFSRGAGPASSAGGDGHANDTGRGGGLPGNGSDTGNGTGGGAAGEDRKNFFTSMFQLQVATPYEGEQAIGLTMPALPAPLYTPPDSALAVVKDADVEHIRRREAIIAAVRAGLRGAELDAFITVEAEGDGVRLNIPNSILFESGTAELTGRGPAVIKALAPTLVSGDFTVAVEGHTDDQPISTPRYPSNWELSASRAASVVRTLVAQGMQARRLEAIGLADSRPLTDNATEDGRRENRRVTLLLRAP